MKRQKVAVQIGHIGGRAGARYEEETLKIIFPHIVEFLKKEEAVELAVYDGSLERQAASFQYQQDVFVAFHCDSNSELSSGFSLGYSLYPQHPGSEKLANCLKTEYAKASNLRLHGINHTPGLRYYYGYRRMTAGCKCALLEFGFVSNPKERQFLRANAENLASGASKGILKYLGLLDKKPKGDEAKMGIFAIQGEVLPSKSWATTAYSSKKSKAFAYLDLLNLGKDNAVCTVHIQRSNGDYGRKELIIPANKPEVPGFKVFELGELFNNAELGNVSVEVISNIPIIAKLTQIM